MVEVLKFREKPKDLAIMEILHNRMELTENDRINYLNMEKGFRGEVMFDEIMDKLRCECYVLNDLLLKFNNTTFQIDKLVIAPAKIHLYEVKFWEDDYLYENDRFYKLPKSTEKNNPLTQLSRATSLFRQLLQTVGSNLKLDSLVLFNHPNFTLFQAPYGLPILLPNQLTRYMKHFETSTLKLEHKHKLLAEKLVSMHIKDSPFRSIPSYEFSDLKKGVICQNCGSFDVYIEANKVKCHICGYVVGLDAAILDSIKELKLLFPSYRLTTRLVHEWCLVVNSKKTIQRVLSSNFKLVGVQRWAYYEEKE